MTQQAREESDALENDRERERERERDSERKEEEKKEHRQDYKSVVVVPTGYEL